MSSDALGELIDEMLQSNIVKELCRQRALFGSPIGSGPEKWQNLQTIFVKAGFPAGRIKHPKNLHLQEGSSSDCREVAVKV